jgi:hypothetical protein
MKTSRVQDQREQRAGMTLRFIIGQAAKPSDNVTIRVKDSKWENELSPYLTFLCWFIFFSFLIEKQSIHNRQMRMKKNRVQGWL